MYKYWWIKSSFLVWILLVLAMKGYGQDTLSVVVDSLEKKPPFRFKPTGLRFGVDLGQPLRTIIITDYEGYEVLLELLFQNRLFLRADVGYAKTIRGNRETYTYQSSGNYIRVGADYNFWHVDKNRTGTLFTGSFRYGLALYDHRIGYLIDRRVNTSGPLEVLFAGQGTDRGILSQWIELGGSIQINVFDHLFFGPFFRLGFLLHTSKTEEVVVNDIPGFGLKNRTNPVVGYSVKYRIAW